MSGRQPSCDCSLLLHRLNREFLTLHFLLQLWEFRGGHAGRMSLIFGHGQSSWVNSTGFGHKSVECARSPLVYAQ